MTEFYEDNIPTDKKLIFYNHVTVLFIPSIVNCLIY